MISIAATQDVRFAYANARHSWEFDERAIRAALRELGVKGDVAISSAIYANGRWNGMYSFVNGRHQVRVRAGQSPAAASRTLWHELTHAKQESEGRRVSTAMSVSARSRLTHEQYQELPNEAEAKRSEARAEAQPLVKAR